MSNEQDYLEKDQSLNIIENKKDVFWTVSMKAMNHPLFTKLFFDPKRSKLIQRALMAGIDFSKEFSMTISQSSINSVTIRMMQK